MDQSAVRNPRVAGGIRGDGPQGAAAFRVESDLYAPVKAFLEARGYEVKGEVNGCDVVGVRGAEPPVIVELKLAFALGLVLQGVDRLSLTDHVYLAVPRPGRRAYGVSVYRSEVRGLCRRLGLGLMTVASGPAAQGVEVLLDPLPYRPRRGGKRLARLLGEHARRAGDPNRGGANRTPVVTAYRQEALRCALLIGESAARSLHALRETGLVPNAPRILQRDVYGWFERVARATYRLTSRAQQDIARFAAAGRLPALPDRPTPLTAPASVDSVLSLRSGASALSLSRGAAPGAGRVPAAPPPAVASRS